jgi:putative glycerol-1-phosphate prenyltransferase
LSILLQISNARNEGKKLFAQLLDPDKIGTREQLYEIARIAEDVHLDLFLFGGSLITKPETFDILKELKAMCKVPVVLFPSSPAQIRTGADAVLFISLISGRNAEYLIGHHVTSAPYLKSIGIEILPTGYMLVDAGAPNTALYVSNTYPIPSNKPEIAVATAIAGEMLGLKLIYLDAGSGAAKAVNPEMVAAVRKATSIPLIVGGGVKSAAQAKALHNAGADIIVVGTAAENNPGFISELCALKAE